MSYTKEDRESMTYYAMNNIPISSMSDRRSRYVTAQEAAKIMNLSERHIQGLAKAGKLPAKKDGKRWMIEINTTTN